MYTTTVLTKASHGMPRHKVKNVGQDPSKWCEGSDKKPARSQLLSERADPSGQHWSHVEPGRYDHVLSD